MFLAVLTTDLDDIGGWVASLSKKNLPYDVIDIAAHTWLEDCLKKSYDLYLLRAPGNTNQNKQMFDERIFILGSILKKNVYPAEHIIKIYENKKFLSYWLEALKVHSPKTTVFYKKQDALDFLINTKYPLVAKINIGSSGKGVKFLRDRGSALEYVIAAFRKGIKPYIGPNFRTASVITKIKNAAHIKGLLIKRWNSYQATSQEPQRYVIFQEFVPHDFEWRVVVIGESYFAHKKMVTGTKASGSLEKDYGNPPLDLLNFAREFCESTDIFSASIDIFESSRGYLINEVQTFFGQSDTYQMKVDGVIGRYRYLEDTWSFEPGDFASNQCYDLRLEHALTSTFCHE